MRESRQMESSVPSSFGNLSNDFWLVGRGKVNESKSVELFAKEPDAR
jgi:hypothetical protein